MHFKHLEMVGTVSPTNYEMEIDLLDTFFEIES